MTYADEKSGCSGRWRAAFWRICRHSVSVLLLFVCVFGCSTFDFQTHFGIFTFNVSDTVDYRGVMSQFGLGPNGAIVTSLNLFATRFDQVSEPTHHQPKPNNSNNKKEKRKKQKKKTTNVLVLGARLH